MKSTFILALILNSCLGICQSNNNTVPAVSITKTPCGTTIVSPSTPSLQDILNSDQTDSIFNEWKKLDSIAMQNFMITNRFGSGAMFQMDTLFLELRGDVKFIKFNDIYYEIYEGELQRSFSYKKPLAKISANNMIVTGTGNIQVTSKKSPPASKISNIKKTP